jgi:hypothetical protein
MVEPTLKQTRDQLFGSLYSVRGRLAIGALAVLFAGFHLWVLPQSLEDIDSINLALGLHEFNVAKHQPHPPGYPVFIAAGRALLHIAPTEAQALGAASAVGGGVAILGLAWLFRRLAAKQSADFTSWAAIGLVVTCPLFSLSASRPLTDMAGLAAALVVQALILGSSEPWGLGFTAVAASFAVGIRSQVAWLVFPLLARQLVQLPSPIRRRAAIPALVGLSGGTIAWLAPVVLSAGGVRTYWQALTNQGADDFRDVAMLATSPTPRHAFDALRQVLIAPWASSWVGGIVIAGALVGLVAMVRRTPTQLVVLLTAFAPYFLFCLLFQETATTRYALPLVVPVGYLAARALPLIPSARVAVAVGTTIAIALAIVDVRTVSAYASMGAPTFRMFDDMSRIASASPNGPRPVLAMHARYELSLRRPIQWLGAHFPPFERRLSGTVGHEWLELVRYWNGQGRAPVWFVADPQRTDLALIRGQRPPTRYRWPFDSQKLLSGIRPNEVDWYAFEFPDWYLGEGWALTPETGGIAAKDGRGPGYGDITGWVRRWPGAVNILVGGRNLTTSGGNAHLRIAIDGKPFDEILVAPGSFLRIWSVSLPPSSTNYAAITLDSDSKALTIDQFDAQPNDQLIFGFADGWYAQELDPPTGVSWRWASDRAVLHVRPAGHSIQVSLRGELEANSTSHVTIRGNQQQVTAVDVDRTFDLMFIVPGDVLTGSEPTISIESSVSFVPAERDSRSRDHRRLALKLRECRLMPTP